MALRRSVLKNSMRKSVRADSFNVTSELFDAIPVPLCTKSFVEDHPFDLTCEMCPLQQESTCSNDVKNKASTSIAMERAISSTVATFFHLHQTPNKSNTQPDDGLGPRYPCDGQESSPAPVTDTHSQPAKLRSKSLCKSIAKKLKLFHKQSKSSSSSLKTLAVL